MPKLGTFGTASLRSLGFGGYVPPPATYSVTPTATSLNEGSSVTFNVTTTNVLNGTTLYWDNTGTTTGPDFSGGANSGSFTITSNAGSVTLTLLNDLLTEGSETIIFNVRTGSTSGTIVATAATVTVNDTSISPTGSILFGYAAPGTQSWVVPTGVTSVCVLCVGSGGGSNTTSYPGAFPSGGKDVYSGGAGGGLGYYNNFPVTPGATYTVVVAAISPTSTSGNNPTGIPTLGLWAQAALGSASYFGVPGVTPTTALVFGGGATRSPGGFPTPTSQAGIGGTYVGTGGGNGGSAQQGHQTGAPGGPANVYYNAGSGGGAGGYSGNGGNGGPTQIAGGTSPGGGGGGGGGAGTAGGPSAYPYLTTGPAAGSGGGVGIYGQGTNGTGGAAGKSGGGPTSPATNGSSGAAGSPTATGSPVTSPVFPGGGQAGSGGGASAAGAVRIIWGPGRSFPSTNTVTP